MVTRTGPQAHDAADNVIRREASVLLGPTAAAALAGAFQRFQAVKLVAVHGVVHVAGTGTTAGHRILIGTASVGVLTQGTSAIGASVSVVLNTVLTALERVVFSNVADATIAQVATLEYEVQPGAARTVS
jgi:hypothetical protein